MKFDLALKKLHKGIEIGREHEVYTLRMEKDKIIRRTKNGARTVARVASHDLLAEDWICVKGIKPK